MPDIFPRAAPADWQPALLAANHPLHGWLGDTASLTARIEARCDQLRVKVLSQGLARPHHDEAVVLGLRAGELVCMREVLLIADDRPVVYARSLLAREDLRGAWRMFAGIGGRPLGAALFADPLVRRAPLNAHRMDARDTRYCRIASFVKLDGQQALWARRSCFLRHERPLIVCEVFLPAIRELQK
ncbi:MAG: Chorismate lyase [Rhodocyclales bacterium]|nr:Chorismate lyase [Rhodocyclales bacterium]